MTKKTTLLLIILLCATMSAFAQKSFEEWNKNYNSINLTEILKYEQEYADSIDVTLGKSNYYTRIAKYRFMATYLGESRTVDTGVMRSMLNVFKLFGGDTEAIKNDVKSEYLFQVGDITFWAPIQSQLEKPLKKEVKKGESVRLYCLFLNEHSSNGLYNSFLISEFYKH
ncbi:hypothetical protein [Pontibacter cellulosilyticus]|uniref:DUF3828 domain-containing protein n=1 Tax=Pontibacter cellulosilyticus TaxID=1720253 RepID=A0A923N7Q6_9BACT|nr:hypothetical protein [Pontibacter cellulosilyticus]MBC5993753.1 hypothetical protein [Pontibacter cellulosilyticus]